MMFYTELQNEIDTLKAEVNTLKFSLIGANARIENAKLALGDTPQGKLNPYINQQLAAISGMSPGGLDGFFGLSGFGFPHNPWNK